MAGLKTLKFKYFAARKMARLAGIPFRINEVAYLRALMEPCTDCKQPGGLGNNIRLEKPSAGYSDGNMKSLCQDCYLKRY